MASRGGGSKWGWKKWGYSLLWVSLSAANAEERALLDVSFFHHVNNGDIP